MPFETRVYVRGRRVRDIAECDSADRPTDTAISYNQDWRVRQQLSLPC